MNRKPSIILQNCANIAQVLLVILAFFGYFYTVRPIYQKDLLEEEVAEQKESLQKLKDQNKALIEENEFLTKTNFSLKRDKQVLNNQISEMTVSLLKLKESYRKIKTDLRMNVMKYFKEHIKSKLPIVPTNVDVSDFIFIFSVGHPYYSINKEPTAERVIMRGLADFEQFTLLDDEDRRAFENCTSSYLMSHPREVQKMFNLIPLLDEYKVKFESMKKNYESSKKHISKDLPREEYIKKIEEIIEKINKENQGIFDELAIRRDALSQATLNAVDNISKGFISGNDCSSIGR